MDQTQDIVDFGERLSALPTEILIYIFQSLPKAHLKALRLRSRVFEPVASQFLFHTLSFAPRKRQLRVLAHVANHPVLSRYLRHLLYDFSRYRYCNFDDRFDEGSQSNYTDHLRNHMNISLSDRDLTASWLHYRNLHKDEYWIIRTNGEARILAKNLPKLRNLHLVSAAFNYTGPYRWSGAPPKAPERVPSPHYMSDEPLQYLFHAINDSGVSVDTFSVCAQGPECGLQVASHIYGRRNLTSAHHFFANLTRVEITYPGEPDEKWHLLVSDLLRSARVLRHLKLALGRGVRYRLLGACRFIMSDHYTPLVKQVGQGSHWPMLESLELEELCFQSNELLEFIGRHATSLQRISLQNIVLAKGSWDDIVDSLMELRIRKIRIETPGTYADPEQNLKGRWSRFKVMVPTAQLYERMRNHQSTAFHGDYSKKLVDPG